MPKKDMKNNYTVRFLHSEWDTNYYVSTYREAIHDFLNDPNFDFEDGEYIVEVDGKGRFKAQKETVCKSIVRIGKKL